MSEPSIVTIAIRSDDLLEQVAVLRSRSDSYTQKIGLLDSEGKRTVVIAVTHLFTFTRQLEDSQSSRNIATIFTSRTSVQRKALETLVTELQMLKTQSENLKHKARALQEQIADMFSQASKTKSACMGRLECADELKEQVAQAKESAQIECQFARNSAELQQIDVDAKADVFQKYSRKEARWDQYADNACQKRWMISTLGLSALTAKSIHAHYDSQQNRSQIRLNDSQTRLDQTKSKISHCEIEINSLNDQASELSGLIKEVSAFQDCCRSIQDRAKKLDPAAGLIINSVTWMLTDLVAIQRNGARLLQDDANRAGLASAVFDFLEHADRESLIAGDKRLQQIGSRLISAVSETERSSRWSVILRNLW